MIKPVYSKDGIELYKGDSIKLLPSLNLKADMVFHDPPFAVRDDQWDTFESFEHFERFTRNWLRAASNAAPLIASFFADRFIKMLWDQAEAPGLEMRFRRFWMWQKTPGSPMAGGNKDGAWYDFELIPIFGQPAFPLPTKGHRFSVMPSQGVQRQKHGCEKPLRVLGPIIATYAREGALVIDMFAGTGATLRAARALGRRAVGIELRDEAIQEAIEKIEAQTQDDMETLRAEVFKKTASKTKAAARARREAQPQMGLFQ